MLTFLRPSFDGLWNGVYFKVCVEKYTFEREIMKEITALLIPYRNDLHGAENGDKRKFQTSSKFLHFQTLSPNTSLT